MSANVNVGRGPAPIQSPMHTAASHEQAIGTQQDRGLATTAWGAWFNGLDSILQLLGVGYYVVPINSGNAIPQPAQGLYQEIDATGNVTVAAPGAGGLCWLVLILKQDATGGRVFTLNSIYHGVLSSWISEVPSTYTALSFVLRPDGNYMLTGAVSGGNY